ncbi:MAG: hypothetical protein HY094_07725 [Candidatus Melainabacteria bacterium]|nr:hypothetical protein [Candidatus Melainabacteria bacterium]
MIKPIVTKAGLGAIAFGAGALLYVGMAKLDMHVGKKPREVKPSIELKKNVQNKDIKNLQK